MPSFARLSSGASGIWNFAYGANMNKNKFSEVGAALAVLEFVLSRCMVRKAIVADLRRFSPICSLCGMVQSRNLHPVESKPAKLCGFSLSFQHRGGFGTVHIAETGKQAAEVHGVLHRLSVSEYCKLCGMEHEYRWQSCACTPLFHSIVCFLRCPMGANPIQAAGG